MWVTVWVNQLTHILTHTKKSKMATKKPRKRKFSRLFELRAEYATNLYLNEGGVTYSEEDMAAEIANVTYWTWEELENPPFEPGTTMRTMAQFFIDQGQIEADSLSNITDSLKYETYRTEILDYHNSH